MNAQWAEQQEQRKAQENLLRLRLGLTEKCAHLTEHLANRADRIDALFGHLGNIAIDMLADVRFLAGMMESHPDPILRESAKAVLKNAEEKLPFKGFNEKQEIKNESD